MAARLAISVSFFQSVLTKCVDRVVRMKLKVIVVLIVGLLGVACNESAPKEVVPYVAPSPGLLANSEFVLSSAGRMDSWVLTQHTGAPSYALDSQDGVASIERIDKEPWGLLKQVFRHKSTKSLQGKKLEFSADISGEFSPAFGVPFTASGLGVRVRAMPAQGASSMFADPDLIFDELVPVKVAIGALPWSRYRVQFDVPPESEASFVEIEVFFQMTYGGTMQIRGPALIELN